MDERRVADYFVVAGLPDQPEPLGDLSRDGAHLKATFNQAPITDVTVIFPGLGEDIPPGYHMIDTTPTGLEADLNHGSLRSPQVYLCYRRGRDRLPLVDIGVMYEGKERIMSDSEVVETTPGGRVANVNNSAAKTFVTYRRAPTTMPCNELVVTDICVILASKGETPPHAFCRISKNLNKGMVGSDVFLCYKKSMNRANLIPYKPGILARYPHSDYSNFPLPPTVPMFCLPMGSTIECWPATAMQPRPVFSTFVLTVSDAAEKVYGSAVTFYERIPTGSLTAEQCHELQINQSADDEKKTVNINKCICLLSHWPFFDTFEKFLMFLYEMACSGSHSVPIERHISHFLENVPFPSPQRPRILVQLSATERVVLTQPEDLPLPRSGASFRDLLMSLGADNCLMIMLLALTEQKLLVHSLRPDVLTAVAEAVSMMIFPFKWQCPYIPLCPLGLAEVLHAPLPFLIGVDSRFFDLYDPPSDVTCVDLDTNNITLCEEKRGLTSKLLPKRPARALRNTLEELANKLHQFMSSVAKNSAQDASIDRDFQQKRKEQSLELEIQEAFLRFMATVLKGYRTYLLPITKAPTIGTTDPSSLFHLQGFLRSRDKTHHKFFNLIMKTQMFIRFIEERSFVSDMDASLAFFDECTEKVESDDGDNPLVELDESHQSERTVFIMPPEPNGLPRGRMYSYKSFVLDPLLYSRKELSFRSAGSRLSGVMPGSPMARRTKHEIKSAQKLARKHATSPELWAKCLLTTCYSLWFIHLPSYAMQSRSKAPACLQSAYEFLVKIQKMKLQPTDEVCYRVMMQLCGVYSQPVLAVKLLSQMKRSGIQPNAITYGFYNRAVLEATWPSDCTNSSQLLWNKVRNVIIGVALFRRAGVRRRVSDDSVSLADATDVISHTSLDSGSSHQEAANVEAVPHDHTNKTANTIHQQDSTDYAAFDRFRSRVGSIVRPSGAPLLTPRTALQQQPFESSAGLLMTGLYDGPTLSEESDLFDGEVPSEGTACVSPTNPRRRNRSGSCSEFMFGLRQGHLSGGGTCQGSPQSPRSSDANRPSECLRLLIRSESFANDAQILDKLNQIKLHLPGDASGMNGRVAPIPEGRGDADKFRVTKPSSSRCLFRRRSSFTFRRTSRESSTENLEERSSAGSTDDLDSTGSCTPKHSASKLFSGLGDHVSRLSSVVWERSGSKGMLDFGYTKSDLQTYVKAHNKKNSSLDSLARVSACDSGGSSSDLEVLGTKRNGVGDTLSRINNSSVREEYDSNCDSQDVIMNRTNNVYDSPSKSPSSLSCKTSPIRTPVTENDPLGALDVQETAEAIKAVDINGDQADSGSASLSSIVAVGILEHADAPGGPVLFGGHTKTRGVSRSATFGHDCSRSECTDCLEQGKSMHRSSTMPVDVPVSTAAGVTSGLGSISSGFKLSFSRYSPARLSLRKADLRINTQIIGNAITNFSPSNLTSKNELLRGGLSTLKSAGNLVAKKFDEIKEAISANNTPVKPSLGHGRVSGEAENLCCEEEPTDGSNGPERRVSNEFVPLTVHQHLDHFSANIKDLFGDGSRKGSSSNLQPLDESGPTLWCQLQLISEQLYPRDAAIRDHRAPVALELMLTTCSKCHNCSSVLHDEEILAGWAPEDSNLNTKCQFCGKATVPFLTVNVIDYRAQPMMEHTSSQESVSQVKGQMSNFGSSTSSVDGDLTGQTAKPHEPSDMEQDVKGLQAERTPVDLEPITVPYLNPLVLRKEFENILYNEGDTCLTQPRFVDEHPIIFWNMVWVFQRINIMSHLPGLCLQAASVNRNQVPHPSWENCDHNNVAVRCMWDNRRLHEEVGQPMYALWQQNEPPSTLVSALITDRTSIPRSVMLMVISGVRCNDLMEPLKKLAIERQKLKGKGVNRSHSLYWDILFLAFTVIGRENIDHAEFDCKYMEAYERLPQRDLKLYQRCDKPPSIASLYCRHYFKELEL
ncbi:DENN domain-containing protein Crag isoform X4 [Cryptotermes secundus]|uniref:DENN domain-containing protein Crag isoform X4 n=1 Tax=Cryptotermes secundus TaxID=105785 RepID=UPI000CD7C59E|nr:DENN domain-containing protein Crag isoform X4 [Cryptotermes secundus]